jgi:AhpD family alkylhydroperoxidase
MSKIDSLSHASHLAQTALFAQWAPAALKGFQALAAGAFAEGALSVKEKELIAFGCAHVLRCPYCIDYHHGLAGKAGATREELIEALWVGIGVAANGPLAHASIALRLLDGEQAGDYYPPGSAQGHQSALGQVVPAAMVGFEQLQSAVLAPGALPRELKLLIAVACAHNARCAFSIEQYVSAALAAGSSRAQVSEAIFVAIEMAAGACLGHAGLAAALMA